MKKTLKMFTAALMVMVLAAVTPLQSYAAEQKTYISDLQVIYASSYDDAKKQASEGYTVINQKMDGEQGVWLSYKSTTNKDEAITDIAAMNMNGGWSAEEFDKLLANKKTEIAAYVKEVMTAVKGYQKNYKASEPTALFVHDVLNRIIDDDSNMGMGDLLLQSDAETRLNTIVLQATPLTTDTILTYLGIANDGDWVKNVKIGEEVEDAADAANRVDQLYDLLPGLYQGFQDYENTGIKLTEVSTEELNKYCETTSDGDVWANLGYGAAYEVLSTDNADLLALLNQDPENISKEDLLPVAAAMSDELMECIDSLGLASAIAYSGITEESLKSIKELDVYKSTETVSVYAGVDRSIFEGTGVAMTSAAIRSQSSSNKVSSTEQAFNVLLYIALGAAGGAIAAGVIAGVAYAGIKLVANIIMNKAYDPVSGIDLNQLMRGQDLSKSAIKSLKIGGEVVAVLMAVALLVFFTALILKAASKDKRDVKYTNIPRILISQEIKDGKEYLISYKAVADTSGTKYADLNNWSGSQWNALYYTKNKTAGNPLTTDYFTGSDLSKMDTAKKTYTSVHPFGSTAAYDLNAYHWSQQSALYVAFVQDTETTANAAATSVSATGYAISAVAGVAIGAIATWLIERTINKKKKAVKV